MFSDEAEQTDQTDQAGEDFTEAAAENDTQEKNIEEAEPAELDEQSGEEQDSPQEERDIPRNEESSSGETVEEQAVLELSHDMLVDVKEEKAKKKSRKRKEEKEEKTGLDILLDYSPRNSGEQKNDEEEEENRLHKKELIQLSFFPIDDENENK